MKQFLLYIVQILVGSFLLSYAVQLAADSGLKKMKNTLFSEWNAILKGTINADMVILGSSRGVVSYDPDLLSAASNKKVHNLSFNAGSYNLQELKYSLYAEHNKKPKIILQNVDLAHFTPSAQLPEEHQFLPYLNDQGLKKGLGLFDSRYLWVDRIPLLKYNTQKRFLGIGLGSFLGKKFKNKDSVTDGFSPKSIAFKRDGHNLKRLSDPAFKRSYEKDLAQMKLFMKARIKDSITVILVWAPEYKERLAVGRRLTQPLKQALADFAKEQKGVYFLDMSEDSLSQSSDYFYDTFHLNTKGAHLFSATLAQKIKDLERNAY